jgi:hypothetical protein
MVIGLILWPRRATSLARLNQVHRVRTRRGVWFALFYTLATLLAQGPHDHNSLSRRSAATDACGSGTCPHVSGHLTTGWHHDSTACLACQFRFDHHAFRLPDPPTVRPAVALAVELSAVAALHEPTLRPTCRAPPLA